MQNGVDQCCAIFYWQYLLQICNTARMVFVWTKDKYVYTCSTAVSPPRIPTRLLYCLSISLHGRLYCRCGRTLWFTLENMSMDKFSSHNYKGTDRRSLIADKIPTGDTWGCLQDYQFWSQTKLTTKSGAERVSTHEPKWTSIRGRCDTFNLWMVGG